jgi:hypothetical protein
VDMDERESGTHHKFAPIYYLLGVNGIRGQNICPTTFALPFTPPSKQTPLRDMFTGRNHPPRTRKEAAGGRLAWRVETARAPTCGAACGRCARTGRTDFPPRSDGIPARRSGKKRPPEASSRAVARSVAMATTLQGLRRSRPTAPGGSPCTVP